MRVELEEDMLVTLSELLSRYEVLHYINDIPML
jgi:hypothetical protein